MNRYILVMLLFLLSFTSVASCPIERYENVHYFLVMGQSNAVTDKDSGFGSAFIKESKKLGMENVVLIPMAVPGSSILEWQKGGKLYSDAIARVKDLPPGIILEGVIFFQGEADTDSEFAYVWSELFLRMIENLKDDLNKPDLRIVFAQIACKNPKERIPYCSVVQKEQANIHQPNISMIVTSDLPYKPNDLFHLSKNGYNRVGIRFARAFKKE